MPSHIFCIKAVFCGIIDQILKLLARYIQWKEIYSNSVTSNGNKRCKYYYE